MRDSPSSAVRATKPVPSPLTPAPGAATPDTSAAILSSTVGKYRWTICALLFFATTINYVDRQVTGILGPTLQAEFGWSEQQYADVTSAYCCSDHPNSACSVGPRMPVTCRST